MQKKKLVLSKETLRDMVADRLRLGAVHGGDETSNIRTICLTNCPMCPSMKCK